MIAALTNHLWQSTSFVVIAWLVTIALRKNGAHVRHAIWVLASLKFLLPLSLLLSLGQAVAPLLPPTARAAPAVTTDAMDLSAAVERVVRPFADDGQVPFVTTPTSSGSMKNRLLALLPILWLCGTGVVMCRRIGGWLSVRATMRAGEPLTWNCLMPVRSVPGLLEPGVVGVWRPVLLVPEGIEQHLTPSQLATVIAHETCHVRRRDNLTAALHMVVESIFWFFPPVWFVGARMVDERERACDEYVLRVCGEPQTYAESIVTVCKFYVESPLACVSGVTGSDLKKRIATIMVNRVGRQLNTAHRMLLTTAAVLAVVLPIVAGVITAPLRTSLFAQAQARNTGEARFDVVSIKPCEGGNRTTVNRVAPPAGYRGAGPATAQTSPGYVYWDCISLSDLIEQAYVDRDHPLLNSKRPTPRSAQPPRVRNGPSWIETDRFTVEAKGPLAITAEGLAGTTGRYVYSLPPAMGDALRAALEDRFQLKLHRATEERDLYAMSVAKGGLNKARITKPTPGDCQTSAQYDAAGRDYGPFEDPKICGLTFSSLKGQFSWSVTMRQLASDLSSRLDRFVIDQTGLDGPFNFALALEGDSGRGDWLVMVGVLGLKIDATKGPVEYIVIDHVQKPRPNVPAEFVEPPARAQGDGGRRGFN